ncbi:hypothetical protein DKX38_012172 [Salix brachista]|uniref:Amino acid transporter transmembrane domain-containing protein n=1 Tax=Salix brachista TaxID=2182728 RepID=A0A5N5LN23_9ROSI|nr:hypothetical protein DKX38_012172 [Salix brachista]
MGTLHPTSEEVSEIDYQEGTSSSEQLDAGALFVLKSRGSWLHCGYHLTTSIVAPSLLSLPYALSLMGWFPGVLCLILAALVTFYSYNLLSLVLEHHAQLGRRQLRFRVMAEDILGPAWGRYFVGPIQFGVCYGSVIACILLGGQSLKFIYLLSTPKGSIQLYGFVSIFGILMLVLAQIPSFHSLRHISLVSLVLALAYSACTTAGSVHIGNSKNAPPKDYSIDGIMQNRVFGAFSAISIIATTYGNGIIPEIQVFFVPQATVAPPVEGKMFKGLLVCYAVIIMTFFSVAISGYWAFGNQTKGVILMNFVVDEKPSLPTWVLLMTNVFTLLQVAAVSVFSYKNKVKPTSTYYTFLAKHLSLQLQMGGLEHYFTEIAGVLNYTSCCDLIRMPRFVQVYLQPTNDVFERKFSDAKSDQFSIRNAVPRLVFRSLSVIIATAVAAMFPFFGDINAVIGAFGFIPLDFILPVIFYNVTFKPSKKGLMFWGNTAIAIICSAVGVLGAISSIRQIILDANTYSLFANV